jgi:hypothetical protein
MKEFIKLVKSDKPLKKYVFIYKEDGKIKKKNFGSKGSNTYLDHHDKTKRDNYLKRHKVNEDWTKINAGSLSAYILWGNSTDITKNLKDYLKRFKFS